MKLIFHLEKDVHVEEAAIQYSLTVPSLVSRLLT